MSVIPKAIREQVWIKYIGKKYKSKCTIKWCTNQIDVFNFHAGHNIPFSKGGQTTIENLRPICARCNVSMSNTYTIDTWDTFGKKTCCWFISLW
jgi:5-methylcytosine-specific restriction endonuclease McrA